MKDKRTANHNLPDDKARILAAAVLESSDAITAQDLQGRIIAWNRGAERLYGYKEAEALNMDVSQIIPTDQMQETRRLLKKLIAGKGVGSVQARRTGKEGNTFEVWLTMTKIVDDNGNIIGIASNERDITEHSRLLEEVETSLALAEEYVNDIDRLVAERTAGLIALNIADKVINPAVVISMTCSNLLNKESMDESGRKKLEIIRQESDNLQRIVNEFTEFVKKKTTLFQYEDLNAVVKEAGVLIKKEAEEKGVALDVSLSGKPLMINMNKHVLRTAIFYLLKKSLEATSKGGSIKAWTSEDIDSVSLSISDTGFGIAEKNINKVFDHFFTAQSNGVGMGLPFVRHIIEEHYGTLKIESEQGRGATCTINFPMRWLKFSDGRLLWEKPMPPMSVPEKEYPLQKKPDS